MYRLKTDSQCRFVFLVFIFCHLLTHCASAVNQTSYAVEDKAAYITLVQHHAKYCGHVYLCSVTVKAKIPTRSHLCCMSCSCDSSCVRNRNCCVDYYLMDRWNMSTFSDVTKFISTLNNITDVEDLEFPDALIQSDILSDEENTSVSLEMLECSPASLFPTLETTTVRMITKCPKDYANTAIINKCETSWNYDNDVNLDLIRDITPVTSIENGYIYKNRFCFICHTPDGLSLSWNVIYELNAVASNLNRFSRSFEELFETFGLFPLRGYNVLFLPPNEQIVTSKIESCTIIDIETCENQTRTDVNKACSMFRAPVANAIGDRPLVRDEGISRHVFVTLANTACIDCIYSDVTTFPDCSLPGKLRLVLQDLPRYEEKLANESGHNLDVQFSSNCGVGYIHDERKQLCRHVECPMYWFIESGECVPMVSKILNGVYSINLMLRVRLESSSSEQKHLFETTIGVLVQAIITIHFETADPLYALNVGELRNPNQNQAETEYFVNLQIKSDDVAFVHILKLLSNLLLDIKQYAKNKNFETSVAITNIVTNSKEDNFKLFNPLRSDRELVMKWSNNVTFPEIIITLGRTYICHRVLLNRDEFYDRVGRHYFIAKLNGDIVLGQDLQIYQDEVIDCIDNAVNVPKHVLYLNLDGDKDATTRTIKGKTLNANERHMDSSHTRGLWSLVAIAAIVILLVISAKLRKKLRRQQADLT